jgi:hypothetical protein
VISEVRVTHFGQFGEYVLNGPAFLIKLRAAMRDYCTKYAAEPCILYLSPDDCAQLPAFLEGECQWPAAIGNGDSAAGMVIYGMRVVEGPLQPGSAMIEGRRELL